MLVLLAVLAVDATVRALDVVREARAASGAVTAMRRSVSPLLAMDAAAWPNRDGYDGLVRDVDEAHTHLVRAGERLGYLRWFAEAARPVPAWGEQIAAGPDALDLGERVTAHTAGLLREASPLFTGTAPLAERVREVLVTRQANLDAELAGLEAQAARAQRLTRVRWSGPGLRAKPLVEDLARDLGRVSTFRQLAASASVGFDPFMGFQGRRTYIVLGQNEQEIRPTGGFIGTMGTIVIENGKLVSSEYRSSYGYDPKTGAPPRQPPSTLNRYMGATRWYVRDANWDAEFPYSAQRIIDFVKQDTGIVADGVIAVNSPMLRALIRGTGPVTVPGLAEPLTADNFFSLLEEEIFYTDVGSQTRKGEFLQPVLRQMIERLQNVSADGAPALLATLRAGAVARDLQAYSTDTRVQSLFGRLGVDGILRPTVGRDFLGVVDSNISYIKIGAVIARETIYLARDDGKVDLLVRWTNSLSTFQGQRFSRLGIGGDLWDFERKVLVPAPRTFGNYVRFFVPPGTTFEFVEGLGGVPDLEHFRDYTVFGGLVVARDGQTATVRMTYTPGGAGAPKPSGVDFWKQGGHATDSLSVYVATRDTQLTPFSGPFLHDLSFDFPARNSGAAEPRR